ncbi:rhodanese-like domain-containing protein [Cupriavidus basilensis]
MRVMPTPPRLAQWLADASRAERFCWMISEPWEVQTCAMPGIARHPHARPSRRAPHRTGREDADIVCICHHGMRTSMRVAATISSAGATPRSTASPAASRRLLGEAR